MAQAEIQETLSVDQDKLFATITRYEDYPEFVEGCTSVEVDRLPSGQSRVKYHVNLLKEISYTLDLREDREKGVIEWNLVQSDFMKKNSGRWELKAAGSGKTQVKYSVEIDLKFPVPGLIMNRLVKGSLPAMVRSFEKQAQKKR
jgi:ribosome-associated toxin RatA of RatAB toxin-antitoxin module